MISHETYFAEPMNQKYEKLKTLLKELFQLDQPDLDFGLYRIMHAKSAEVSQFLDNDLLSQIKAVFGRHRGADKKYLEKHMSELITGVKLAGMNPDDSPRIADIKILLEAAVDFDALESDVYDHLYRFFKRYYSDGDFLAKRVYKPGVYAIPYEGEEIALHWANKDQYYIKTCEYLRDYVFRLKPEDEINPMRVHFRLVDGTEGEHANVKAANEKNRVFILAEPEKSGHDFIAEENDGKQNPELVINFYYRPPTVSDWPAERRRARRKPPTQTDLIDLAVKRILDVTNLSPWIAELGTPHVMANGEQADYCRLEAHLRRYTARNTFDFFIHKDLGTFLRRELDFYIKNEVMQLDDVKNESILRVEKYLSKIKIVRVIAGKIIDFLVQIEEFQKKLWLKKKFVIETHYCITLGCIPEKFYPEIVANEAQREEWIALYSIDRINGDLVTPGYSGRLSSEFLHGHPTLVVDTRHFDKDFASRVLEAIGDIDELTDGVLFHSENFQALSLMQARYQQQIKCIYIDPPFNTSEASLLYKNEYRHSTWMTLIQQGVLCTKRMLNQESVLSVAIDDFENDNLSKLLESTFGSSGRLGTLIVETKPSGRTNDRFLATCHEYYHFFGLPGTTAQIRFFPLSDKAHSMYGKTDRIGAFKWRDFLRTGGFSTPEERPNSFYPIYYEPTSGEIRLEKIPGAVEILPLDSNGKKRVWRKTPSSFWGHVLKGEIKIEQRTSGGWKVSLIDRIKNGTRPKSVWVDRRYDASSHGTKLLKKLFGEARFSFPKALGATKDVLCITLGDNLSGNVLDYFAGSGTTGHAVINLNREDGGRRKFILVEMGDYFDTVLLPRLKKVTFTPDWKDGKPARLANPQEAERSPRIIKVVRLESYEDTLNNLVTQRSETQQSVLDAPKAQGMDGFKEQYILRYMLDVETRNSQSLLNIQALTDPTSYQLKVKRPGSDESRRVNVDLIETFNWLIGLKVGQISAPQSFTVSFRRDTEKRLCLEGELKRDADGPYWFRTLTGTTLDGRKALVIWRKLTGDHEKDNLVLDEWFTAGYLSTDCEFDTVWVNGGNNLENIKSPSDLWKVRLIEDDFHRLMFNTEGQ